MKGLASFLHVLHKEVKDWPPDRNPLMHNGKFLSALGLLDGESCDSQAEWTDKKQKTKKLIKTMEKKAKQKRYKKATTIPACFALMEKAISRSRSRTACLSFYNVHNYKKKFTNIFATEVQVDEEEEEEENK